MMWNALSVVALFLFLSLFSVHREIHSENRCGMTYMWRWIQMPPVPVANNTVSHYNMYRYFEGRFVDTSLEVLPDADDIPVLFVPGSGGSAKQVRSVASVMMNKTEMRNAPFKMHFYAVDFEEELSFLSGGTLERQRDFVVWATQTLKDMYKLTKTKKLILIGHSFGGVVIRSLPVHPSFDVSLMDVVITLAAPLRTSPVVMDEAMARFYQEVSQIWKIRKSELSHVGVLSYSGGVKDFQVPDKIAGITESFHLPSWSIRDVDTTADHLCILWCNHLVRHSTRLLFDYGMHLRDSEDHRTGRQIVAEFHEKERERSRSPWSRTHVSNGVKKTAVEQLRVFENPIAPWIYTDKLKSSEVVERSLFLRRNVALQVVVTPQKSCGKGVSLAFEYPSKFIVEAIRNESESHLLVTPQEAEGSSRILIKGQTGCQYELMISIDPFATIYLLIIDHGHMIIRFFLLAVLCLSILEFSCNATELFVHPIPSIGGVLGVLIGGPLVFYLSTNILEFVVVSSILLALACFSLVAKMIVWLLKCLPSRLVSSFSTGSFYASLVCVVFNPYVACGLLLVSYALHCRQRFSFLLCVCCAEVLIPIGLTSGNRDDVMLMMHTVLEGQLPSHIHVILPSYPVILSVLLSSFFGSVISSLFAIGTGQNAVMFKQFILRAIFVFAGSLMLLNQLYKETQSLEVLAVYSTVFIVVSNFCSTQLVCAQ